MKKFSKRKKTYKCKFCKDTKFISCPSCSGSGKSFPTDFYKYKNPFTVTCDICEGKGTIECPYCKSFQNEPITYDSTEESIYFTKKPLSKIPEINFNKYF